MEKCSGGFIRVRVEIQNSPRKNPTNSEKYPDVHWRHWGWKEYIYYSNVLNVTLGGITTLPIPLLYNDCELFLPDGLDLRVAPLPRPQQGNAECFKARLSGVVQRQGEEAQQKMSRQRLSDQQPKMAPAGRHSTQRGRALMSKTTDRTSEASNTAAAWHSRCPTQRSQPGDCGTSAQTSNSHGEHRIGQDRHLGHSSKPSHHGNHSQDRFQDNSVQDSSWVEDDESETDWSDEDKEYVYYVNASHV